MLFAVLPWDNMYFNNRSTPMPIFKVLYACYGECEVEAADENEAKRAVADMADSGDASVSFGDIDMHTVNEMIGSIDEFVKKCDGKSRDDIDLMFGDQLAECVRDEMYQYAEALDPLAEEPIRLAFNTLGELHNVQSLKDY